MDEMRDSAIFFWYKLKKSGHFPINLQFYPEILRHTHSPEIFRLK